MVLVKPARADIVIWEELIYSCKIFMGTKYEKRGFRLSLKWFEPLL